jgi:hypothetical protein
LPEQPGRINETRSSIRDEGAMVARDGLEKYRSGSSLVTGVIGLLATAAVGVLTLVDYQAGDWKILVGCAFVGLVVWVVLVRPTVAIAGDRLELRGMLSQVRLPLAAVEDVKIAQYVAVRSAGRTWTCPGVGRSKRQISRMGSPGAEALGARPQSRVKDSGTVANFVTERIEQLAEDARARSGIAMLSDEQFALAEGVRRTWSWPVIAGLLTLTAVFVAAALA